MVSDCERSEDDKPRRCDSEAAGSLIERTLFGAAARSSLLSASFRNAGRPLRATVGMRDLSKGFRGSGLRSAVRRLIERGEKMLKIRESADRPDRVSSRVEI